MSFVAISKVKYPEGVRDEIHAFGKRMIPVAEKQPGFVTVRFHQSTTANETMMYWEWTEPSYHEACMQSDDWGQLMASAGELFQTEGVEFDIHTYERLA